MWPYLFGKNVTLIFEKKHFRLKKRESFLSNDSSAVRVWIVYLFNTLVLSQKLQVVSKILLNYYFFFFFKVNIWSVIINTKRHSLVHISVLFKKTKLTFSNSICFHSKTATKQMMVVFGVHAIAPEEKCPLGNCLPSYKCLLDYSPRTITLNNNCHREKLATG